MDLQLSGQGRGPRWISQHTPTGDNGWRKRQTRLGLGNAAEYSATIRSFINMPAISLVSEPTASRTWGPEHGEDPSPAIMTLAKNFSKYTERSSQSAALQRACASFQRLILLSLCLILREKGSSVEEIDHIISWLSPVERVRHDCLKGAKWVNEAILALHLRQGWSLQRATELFFLVPTSTSRLRDLHKTDPAEFASTVPKWQDQKCLTPHFTLPTLLWELLQAHGAASDIESLEHLCRLLAYDDCTLHAIGHVDTVSDLVVDLQFELYKPLSPEKTTDTRISEAKCTDSRGADNTEIEMRRRKPLTRLADPDLVALLSLFQGPPGVRLSLNQLLRGISPQKRWGENGEIRIESLADAGLTGAFLHLFQDTSTLFAAVASAEKQSLLCKVSCEDGDRVYTLPSSPQFENPGKPNPDGLKFICHILPREEALEPDFQMAAASLVAVFELWLAHLQHEAESIFPLDLQRPLIEACLAFSKVDRVLDASLALRVVKQLCSDDMSDYLRLELALARSTLLRMKGLPYLDESDVVAQHALERHDQRTVLDDIRTQCSAKRLRFSMIMNATFRQDYETALSMVNSMGLLQDQQTTWPELEFHVAQKKLTLLGLIFRYTGRFAESMSVFEVIRTICQTHGGMVHPYHVIRHGAELWCELGEPERAVSLLQEPLLKLRRHESNWDSKHYRRLSLAYVEAQHLCSRFDEVGSCLDELDEGFNKRPPATLSDELDHVRTRMYRMRHAYCKGDLLLALQYASETIDIIDQYSSLIGRDYYRGVTLKFRASLYTQLAAADTQNAEACDQDSRHLIVGLGTYGRNI